MRILLTGATGCIGKRLLPVLIGQGVEMAGLSKKAFTELPADYDVSVINHPTTDLDNDLKNAQDYSV